MLTSNEKAFLNMIKKPCIDSAKEYKILPSVIASLGIIISSWGTSKESAITRNLFLMPVGDNWYGACYSKSSGLTYSKVSDCLENGPILYRMYTNPKDSVKDFVFELMTCRRSKNGLLRYASLVESKGYIDMVRRLVRNGFMQNYLHMIDDQQYIDTIIAIIERYGLNLWDNE